MPKTSQRRKPVASTQMQRKPIPLKQYVRVSDAVELLGVTERTIRRWCKSFRLQWIKDHQGGLLIDADDIELEQAKRAAAPKPVSVVDLQREVADLRRRLSDCEALVHRLMEMIEGEQGRTSQ